MFLFTDPRCIFQKGKVQVQTEFPFYEPGNLVNGKIFIDVMEPIQATYIEIEVKGTEKVAFTHFWTENYQDENG